MTLINNKGQNSKQKVAHDIHRNKRQCESRSLSLPAEKLILSPGVATAAVWLTLLGQSCEILSVNKHLSSLLSGGSLVSSGRQNLTSSMSRGSAAALWLRQSLRLTSDTPNHRSLTEKGRDCGYCICQATRWHLVGNRFKFLNGCWNHISASLVLKPTGHRSPLTVPQRFPPASALRNGPQISLHSKTTVITRWNTEEWWGILSFSQQAPHQIVMQMAAAQRTQTGRRSTLQPDMVTDRNIYGN